MAEGLATPVLTQLEFTPADHEIAERVGEALGYSQMAYTSTSALWGLFCLQENPALASTATEAQHPPYVKGCVIKTKELGFLFVQDLEDLGLDSKGRRDRGWSKTLIGRSRAATPRKDKQR